MKKGFTLVELLAVIVILALILAIAVPTITSLIATSKKNMFENSTKMIIKSMKNDYDGKIASIGSFVDTFILYDNGVRTVYPSSNNLDFTINVTDGGIVRHSDGTVTMALYDGTNCSIKTRTSNDITVTVTDKATCVSNVIYKQATAPFTNLLSNGDFSNGTTGWSGQNSNLSAANNTLTMTGINIIDPSLTNTTNQAASTNKIYVNFTIKGRENDFSNLFIKLRGSTSGATGEAAIYTLPTPAADVWYTQSGIGSLLGTATGNQTFYLMAAAPNALGHAVYLKNIFMINITTTYGAGNEPTQVQMDNNINKTWIDTATNTPKKFTAGGWVNF